MNEVPLYRVRRVLLCDEMSSPSRCIAVAECAEAGEPGFSYCTVSPDRLRQS